jgi:hypothetical protein
VRITTTTTTTTTTTSRIRPSALFHFRINSDPSNPFRYFARIPWMGDLPTTRRLSTQDSTTQKKRDKH